MTDAEFRAWLARDNEERCILVEMDYVFEATDSPAGPTVGTLYLSDKVFHPYIDVVLSAPQFTRSLDQLGRYSPSVSPMELDNGDGQLDFLLNIAVDGSQIRFKYGSPSWPEAAFKHIFSAIISTVSAPDTKRLTVTLKDTGLLLDQSIGGETTVGGTGPNADRARPIVFGYVHNMQPLVSDAGVPRYVYTDDETGAALQEVRDRGVSVAFTDNLDQTFDLSATPDGLITADVLAEPLGSGNVMVSDAVDHLVGTRAGLTARSLYDGAGPTFTPHDGDDYPVGIYIQEARNVISVLDELLNVSGNAFWAVKRTGEFTFGRLRLNDIEELLTDSPALEAVAIVEDDFDEGSFSIEHGPTQYFQFQALMSRNQTRQTDLASSLTPDEQAVFTRPGLYLQQEDSVGSTYDSAPELYHKTLTKSPVIDTLISAEFAPFDTDFLAQWMETRRAMQLPWIEIVSGRIGVDFYELELGDPVRLTIREADGRIRYGLDGTLFQVIGIVIRLSDAKIDIKLARRNVIQDVPDTWQRLLSTLDESQPPYALARLPIEPVDHGGPPIGGGGVGGGPFILPGGGVHLGALRAGAGSTPVGSSSSLSLTNFFGSWAGSPYNAKNAAFALYTDATTPILTQAWDGIGQSSSYPSQNDISGGGFGDFAKTYDDYTFDINVPTIGYVHWTGVYYNGSEATATPTQWKIQVWVDNGSNMPGSLVNTWLFAHGDVHETFLSSPGGFNVFSYWVLITALSATAGQKYWISIQPELVFPPSWAWTSSND